MRIERRELKEFVSDRGQPPVSEDAADVLESQTPSFDPTPSGYGLGKRRQPVIIAGGAAWWPAVEKWTPSFFKERFADVEIRPTLSLPDTGVPYTQTEAAHRQSMRMSEFIDRMAAGERCYLDQSDMTRFDGLAEDLSFESIIPSSPRIINLWLGFQTRSGLHYDLSDNLLVQVYECKKAMLVAPDESRCVYPFGDNVSKSRVDPEQPDLRAYPRFAQARVFTGTLEPGDILFIPCGWWHYLSTTAESISLNCWWGTSLTIAEQVRMVHRAGWLIWLRVLGDFIWYGALRRSFEQRLYSPPPTGKLLYDLLFDKQARP